MLWVKCTTSAECKSIRIAESSVMDGWDDRCLAQCRFWFSKDVFGGNEEGCRTEYLEGTDEEMEMVMCDWLGLYRRVVMFD
jgi:hypothetical protein